MQTVLIDILLCRIDCYNIHIDCMDRALRTEHIDTSELTPEQTARRILEGRQRT